MNLLYIHKSQMTRLFKEALVWILTIAVLFAIGKGFIHLTKPAPGQDMLRFCIQGKKLSDLPVWPELRTVTGEYRVLLNKETEGAVCSPYYSGFIHMFPGQLKSYTFDTTRYPTGWHMYVELGKVEDSGAITGVAKYPLRRNADRALLIVEKGLSDPSDLPITYISLGEQ